MGVKPRSADTFPPGTVRRSLRIGSSGHSLRGISRSHNRLCALPFSSFRGGFACRRSSADGQRITYCANRETESEQITYADRHHANCARSFPLAEEDELCAHPGYVSSSVGKHWTKTDEIWNDAAKVVPTPDERCVRVDFGWISTLLTENQEAPEVDPDNTCRYKRHPDCTVCRLKFNRTPGLSTKGLLVTVASACDDAAIPLRANISETPVVLLINGQGEKEKGRDEREFSWCSFLRGFDWRGTERRRAKRAAARTLNMNDRLRVQVPYRTCWRQL